jgi:hypothetical protein
MEEGFYNYTYNADGKPEKQWVFQCYGCFVKEVYELGYYEAYLGFEFDLLCFYSLPEDYQQEILKRKDELQKELEANEDVEFAFETLETEKQSEENEITSSTEGSSFPSAPSMKVVLDKSEEEFGHTISLYFRWNIQSILEYLAKQKHIPEKLEEWDTNGMRMRTEKTDWATFYDGLKEGSAEKLFLTPGDFSAYEAHKRKNNIVKYSHPSKDTLERELKKCGLSSMEFFLSPLGDEDAKYVIQLLCGSDMDPKTSENVGNLRNWCSWYSQWKKPNGEIDHEELIRQIEMEQERLDQQKYFSRFTDHVIGFSENRLAFNQQGRILNIWDDEVAKGIVLCKVREVIYSFFSCFIIINLVRF